MKIIFFQIPILLLVAYTYSVGQGQPKLVKTQGTSEYANVHCALQDGAGNLWFGTTGEGVYCFDGASFINYTKEDGLPSNQVWCVYSTLQDGKESIVNYTTTEGLCHNSVFSVLADQAGNLWFGTRNTGLCSFNGKTFRLYSD